MKIKKTRCQVCGFVCATIVYNAKYDGYRGICNRCDGNWPES